MVMGMVDLINAVLRCLPWGEVSSHTAQDIADHLAENDVVPVVRCKDCVWYDTGSYDAYCSHLPDGMSYPKEDDFCSCGERRNDG